MVEILDLEDICDLVRKLYGKNKNDWRAFYTKIDSDLINLRVYGPDIALETIQTDPVSPLIDISKFPNPLKPLGKGIILDIDLDKISTTSTPHGFRNVSRKNFENIIKMWMLMERGAPKQEIMRFYVEEIIPEDARRPVVGYEQLFSPVISVGPLNYQSELADISEKQKRLREKLITDVRKLQRKRHPYVM